MIPRLTPGQENVEFVLANTRSALKASQTPAAAQIPSTFEITGKGKNGIF